MLDREPLIWKVNTHQQANAFAVGCITAGFKLLAISPVKYSDRWAVYYILR